MSRPCRTGRFAPKDARQATVDRATDRWVFETTGDDRLVECSNVAFRPSRIEIDHFCGKRFIASAMESRLVRVVEHGMPLLALNRAA